MHNAEHALANANNNVAIAVEKIEALCAINTDEQIPVSLIKWKDIISLELQKHNFSPKT